jgi:glutamate/tyrosine decarboxylase-like PLP-dependent enzyme
MVLRFFGAGGLRDVLSRSIRLARHLHVLVRDHPDFEVLHAPSLYIYSFRYLPHGLSDGADEPGIAKAIDRLNQQIADDIQRSGLALLMTTRVRGRVALRMSICSQRTRPADVEATFEAIVATGRRLAATLPSATREEKVSC